MKRLGFISHINEESRVAEHVKEWLETLCLGHLDIFVSSIDVSVGDWLQEIRTSIKSSSFIFPLLSTTSVIRPWINFESGCAFMTDEATIIPLCHKDLYPSALTAPFSFFQSYDLRSPESVIRLLKSLHKTLGIEMQGNPNVNQFCDEIKRLNDQVHSFCNSFEELRSAEDLRTRIELVDDPKEINVKEINIWDELTLRAVVQGDNIIEANGYNISSFGFSIENIQMEIPYNYVVVELRNTNDSISYERDKFLKLDINRQTIKSSIRTHRHYDDNEFTVKGDGLFIFELPNIVKYTKRINIIDFCFWRIAIRGVVIKLYLA